MISITFAIPDTLNERAVARVVETTVRAIGDMARAEWIRLAMDELNTTQKAYIASIGAPHYTGSGDQFTCSLELDDSGKAGVLARLVEGGWSGGDLRDTLLSSSNRSRKQSAEGYWYAAIPFSHSTPGSSGMGGAPMPPNVYQQAKKLRAHLSGPGSGVLISKGGGRSRLPGGLAPKMKPWHESDIYAGMIKSAKTYARSTQSGYKTFRTISNNPNTRKFALSRSHGTGAGHEVGWIHPGIEAHRLLDKVVSFVEETAGGMVESALAG